MPGKIKVKILAGRNLPVMDRSGDTTDAYVEIKFGNTTFKTDVCRKSLNPQWNSEWYRFEVDDAELQDEPLQVRLMDHDTYSANDAIGKVYVNLNPLLLPGFPPTVKNIWTLEATMNSSSGSQGGSVMTGWIPVFDTMHGIRGEVNIIVKVELFSDCNKFRQSSCGVQFFYSPNIPHGYYAQVIHGFVEELVVSDDPEYKWIDKIRTPRASNEARQTLFFKLSGEVQRKIGLKALDLGGNAVIGYVQNFDLEGESGIVARGIGTAVTLVKLQDISLIFPLENSNIEELTCFDLQYKSQHNLSESDDSLPLLSHSPNHTSISHSPTNFHATIMSPRFPKYDKTRKHSRHAIRVAQYRAAGLRARQLSLQHDAAAASSMRKGIASSLSLADDLISESSFQNMLALEDMRGERVGNPIFRGLKNFRYLHQNILPRRVAQIKSKISDSFDDESDRDSTYSSTWSLADSESNKSSSIVDLRQSIRRKKFTHKKAANNGIAAILIRSVHSSFPLDSVREDRETPTPSPVNFFADLTEYTDDPIRGGILVKKDNEDFDFKNRKSATSHLNKNLIGNQILFGRNKHDVEYTTNELLIPMISSSETDTSTSDEDAPSESSTNYNILDESYSFMDPSSTNDMTYQSNFHCDASKVTKLSEMHGTIGQFSEKAENITINNKNDVSCSTALEPDCTLESCTDYNVLDDTNILIEHSSIDDRKLERMFRQTTEVIKFLEITNRPEGSFEETRYANIPAPIEENRPCSQTESRLEYQDDHDILDKTYSQIDRVSSDNEKFEPTLHRAVRVKALHENSSTIPPILSLHLGKIENHLENSEDVEVIQVKDQSSITLHDCHSMSSTHYNFLDKSYSPNENCSIDDGKIELSLLQAIDDAKFSKFQCIPANKMALSGLGKNEDSLQKIEEPQNQSALDENIISNLQNCSNFVSGTDHNILGDACSLTESNLVDECRKSGMIFQQAINVTQFPEISRTSALISSLPSLQQLKFVSTNQENTEQEPGYAFHSPPIWPNLYTNLSAYSTGNSTSSGPESSPSSSINLKHLKFLQNQNIQKKHFDSIEDVNFNTSIPMETDVTHFLQFEPSKESPSHESFESSKFNLQAITSLSAIEKSDSKMSSNETVEKILHTDVSYAKAEKPCPIELVENTAIQVCPLGISFDKIRIVNETKTALVLVPANIAKIETIDAESSMVIKQIARQKEFINTETKNAITKKGKPKKKIERTDTVIYKGSAKNQDQFFTVNHDTTGKSMRMQIPSTRPSSPIPIFLATPFEEHATRLQVPVIQTMNINVQSTFSHDEVKTQRFGRMGSRKFSVEYAISEKYNRKYRHHCLLDLIKTIDAKMMVHHMHHEHRDSTKSKKKRRECMNASATPSPDSIHRTRPHKRRSKSRSPERQHVVHTKSHVSSLSTYSFPNVVISSIRNSSANILQDSASCNFSSENLSRNITIAPIVVCPKDSNVFSKDNVCSPANNNYQDFRINHKVAAVESPIETTPDDSFSSCRNNEVKSDEAIRESIHSTTSMLDPKELGYPVYKSRSAGSLESLPHRLRLITKTTNTANTTDDLCVPCPPLTLRQQDEQQSASPVQAASALPSSLGSKVTPNASTATKTNTAIPNMHRRSSDSDLSITPKGNSLAGSDRSMGGHMRASTAIVRTMNQDNMEMLEYPFITMQKCPPGFLLNIGGLVSARSVKLLERITNLEEPEGRDAWWTEIRMEVRSHARALACNVVLGYKEEISICDDVCVLNASGTAAVISLLNSNQDQDNVLLSRTLMTTSVESERDKPQVKSFNVKTDQSEETSISGQQTHSIGKVKRTSESNDHEIPYLPTLNACSLCHLPYSESSVPFRVDVSKCMICRHAKVPDVLFTTIELPENIPMTGRGVFLQATVCKSKRDLRGELNAKEISDCLPFLEYELHSLLLNKLKVKGMNAIFGLKVQVSVGERLVIGMAVGTAVYLTALPPPSIPQIASGNSWHHEEQLAEIQKTLIDTVKKNREFYRLKPITDIENGRSITTSDTDESDDDLPDLDLGIGTKDACVLEVDDVEDMDRINLLMDERPPDDFHVVNTQTIPGLEDLEIVRNLQMFTQISRAKIPSGQFGSMPSKYFARMLQTVLFKLRRMVPCALCDMQFKVALPEQDEIQLSVVGMALGLGEPTRFSKYKRKLIPNSTSKDVIKKTDDNDLIFSLDEDQADNITAAQDSYPAPNQSNTNVSSSSPLPGLSAQKQRPHSPFKMKSHMSHRYKHMPLKERYGVDITPLSYLPGGKIERYLGNLNFFFIRESTSIRENGGLSGFTHSFVTEILAIVRAHITALGGNAMVAFFMTQCVLLNSPHKNQATLVSRTQFVTTFLQMT